MPLDEHVPLRERTAAMVLADLPRVFPADAGYQLRSNGQGQVLVSYTRRPTWALAAAVVLALPTLGLGLLLLVARSTHRCVLQFAHEPTMTDPDQAVVHVTGELPADRWEMVQVVAGAVAHPVEAGAAGDPAEWLEPADPGQSLTGMLGFGGRGDYPGPRTSSGPPAVSPASGFPGAYGPGPVPQSPPVGFPGTGYGPGPQPPAPAYPEAHPQTYPENSSPEPDPFDFDRHDSSPAARSGLGEAEHTQRAPQRDLYGDLDVPADPVPRHGRDRQREPEQPWSDRPAAADPWPAAPHGSGQPLDDPFPAAPQHSGPPLVDDPFPAANLRSGPPPAADEWPIAAPPPPPVADDPWPAAPPPQPAFDSLFRRSSEPPPADQAPISRAPFALPAPDAPLAPFPAAPLPAQEFPPLVGDPLSRPAPREPDPVDDPMFELPTRRARRAAPEAAFDQPAGQPEERTVLRSDALSAAMPPVAGEAMLEFDTGERVPVPVYGLLGRNPSPGYTDTDAVLLPVEDPGRSVSKTHLAIGLAADGIWVVDRHSTNGVEVTYRGEQRKLKPGERVLVARGALIKFGDRQLYLR